MSLWFTKIRCEHRWVDDGRIHYVEPRAVSGMYPGTQLDHCIYGVTTIPQRCDECGARRTIKVTGDHRPADNV